jgi:hypothetical protein
MSLLAMIVFALTLFFTSGFIPVALWRPVGGPAWPRASDFVLGYAITALACLASVFALHSLYPGALAVSAAAAWAVVRVWRRSTSAGPGVEVTLSLLVKLTFLGVMALCCGPMLVGQDDWYEPLPVFDLPKQLSAVASAASATGWPMPNPWLPTGDFAYNMLFYAPLGVLARLGGPTSCAPVFAVAMLFVAWQVLGLLEEVMTRLGVARNRQVVGLLFATFISGLTPVVLPTDYPHAAILHYLWQYHKVASFEDPLTLYIYVPQHLFAVGCVLSMWLALVDDTPASVRPVVFAVLSVTACLVSFPLAPLVGVVTLILLGALVARPGGPLPWPRRLAGPALAGLAFLAVVAPAILQAIRWDGGNQNRRLFGAAEGPAEQWVVPLMTGAVWMLFALFGLPRRQSWQIPLGEGVFLRLGVLAGLATLFVAPSGDVTMKWGYLFWLSFLPLTAVGFVRLEALSRRLLGTAGPLACAALLGLLCLNGLTLIGSLVTGAYQERDDRDRQMLRALRALPVQTPVWIWKPDQQLAAHLGRPVYMDFPYREGGYLPVEQQAARRRLLAPPLPTETLACRLDRLADLAEAGSAAVLPRGEWYEMMGGLGVPILGETRDVVAVDLRDPVLARNLRRLAVGLATDRLRGTPVAELARLRWNGIEPPGTTVRLAPTPTVVSAAPRDVWVNAAIRLEPGLYRATARISGHVAGSIPHPGHVSLVGWSKILRLPAGNYPPGTRFDDCFVIGPRGYTGHLAFGLGGWGLGSGALTLEDLTIEKLPITSVAEVRP